MITQHGSRRLYVPLMRVRQVLLDPHQLPAWNPAFLSLRGPRQPQTTFRYPIAVHGGLRGSFEYLHIGDRHVSMTWQVPGFREIGTWYLERRRSGTLVRHEFEHHGDQAELLPALAGLSLHRLAARLTGTGVTQASTRWDEYC